MKNTKSLIAVTGATGQLGRLVLEQLLATVPADRLVAIVRQPSKAADLAAAGVAVRQADYNDAAALDRALVGVDRLLLISSNEIGQRAAQHQRVIDAAVRQSVRLLVYTSLLHADTSTLSLAGEHRETEAALRASGLPHIILRNGWYTENYTQASLVDVAQGAVCGCVGAGRIASAARADYAAAAVVALTGTLAPNQVYELAGDTAYTLEELAAEISRQSGKAVRYHHLSEPEYQDVLRRAGLPEGLVRALPAWDVCASQGALFDESHTLSRLIGRPTTPLAQLVREALAPATVAGAR